VKNLGILFLILKCIGTAPLRPRVKLYFIQRVNNVEQTFCATDFESPEKELGWGAINRVIFARILFGKKDPGHLGSSITNHSQLPPSLLRHRRRWDGMVYTIWYAGNEGGRHIQKSCFRKIQKKMRVGGNYCADKKINGPKDLQYTVLIRGLVFELLSTKHFGENLAPPS